ncbi:EcoKI restriction-modification system protein HsdS [Caballeronia glebae]|uniref:EcoKI restriction-modification system protein HsdS n=2 Tax=Caballeronia glebae TaxID=1777143 RepID=A0A158A2K1_9BURK|nr:EcoKI restriction-modification system protein HsdS [Caballeronia glebae]
MKSESHCPDGWEVRAVRELGEVIAGKALAATAPGHMRPYLRTKNVFDGRIVVDDVLEMPMTDEQFETFRIRKGDVLLNEGQSLELVGRCSIYAEEYPEPCAIQNALLRFRAKPGVSAQFASYVFRNCQKTGSFAKIALQTTSVAHLGVSRFADLQLAWPKKEVEQERIANALSDVDDLIAGLERLIAKKRDIKQAAMQQLLAGRTRLPGFSGEWVEACLEEIAQIEMGQSPSSVNYNVRREGLPLIQGNADVRKRRTIKRIFTTQVTKRGRKGDVLMSVRAPVGEISRATFDCCLGRGVCAIRFPNDFLYHALINLEPRWSRMSKGSTFDSVNSTDVANAIVALPSDPAEQAAIAAILTDMDADLSTLESRLAKTRAIKQGMMQELLTGRTRLVGIAHETAPKKPETQSQDA